MATSLWSAWVALSKSANVNALWRLVRNGEVAYEDITDQRWKHSSFYSPDARAIDKTYAVKGAFIDGIDEFAAAHFGIAPRRLQVTDPQHRILVETVRDALQDAGYDNRPFDRANTGVFIGASVSEYKDILTSRLRAQSIVDGAYGDSLSPAGAEALRLAVADVASIRAFTIAGSLPEHDGGDRFAGVRPLRSFVHARRRLLIVPCGDP